MACFCASSCKSALSLRRDRVVLLRSFDASSGHADLPDPYYGGEDGFDDMLAMIERAMDGLLARVEAEMSARKER